MKWKYIWIFDVRKLDKEKKEKYIHVGVAIGKSDIYSCRHRAVDRYEIFKKNLSQFTDR